MTRKEITGKRPLDFSQWVRQKLPDSSTGFCASDLDFVLWNYKTKKIMMLEIKSRNSYPKQGQKLMWSRLNKWIGKGICKDWEYLGFHLVVFEKTNFEDGIIYLDNKVVSEKELIKFLSF